MRTQLPCCATTTRPVVPIQKKNKLKTAIKKGINENKSFSELRGEIVKFKEGGGSQNEAQRMLEELRNDFENEEGKEDIILDLLDHVTGWCSAENRIWE